MGAQNRHQEVPRQEEQQFKIHVFTTIRVLRGLESLLCIFFRVLHGLRSSLCIFSRVLRELGSPLCIFSRVLRGLGSSLCIFSRILHGFCAFFGVGAVFARF